MLILLFFAFLGGIVTILSPCILPILPIVLSGSLTGGKRRPIGIVTGFIVSFTFFTLFLTTLVQLLGLSADLLRSLAVVIIGVFGISLLFQQTQVLLEKLLSNILNLIPRFRQTNNGFVGGILVGLSLGLIWTPCVGPIMAAMITLAATSSVTIEAVLITLTYALGTAVPLLAITYGGRQLLQKVPWLLQNSARIQKIFGVLMILTAAAIFFNVDRNFQTYILQRFPNYGTGITAFEDIPRVKDALQSVKNSEKKDAFNLSFLKREAPDLSGGQEWFNSPPLSLATLRGKVVLVDFWTYTCINCIRTLPYLKAWHERYKDQGLVIVGVHTPEFEFEKSAANVQKALTDFGITYPVVQDNDFRIWQAYNNRYWPAKYFIDTNGVIRWEHFGEGKYDESERMIQTLLTETGATLNMPIVNPTYQIAARTPELYLGFDRLEYFDSSPVPQLNQTQGYSLNDMQPKKHHFGFVGSWTMGKESSLPKPGASLQLNFEAQKVFLVMRPTQGSAKVTVRLDGQQYGLGKDVTQETVVVNTDRLYQLVELAQPGNHQLYLEFIDGQVEIFAFTFG